MQQVSVYFLLGILTYFASQFGPNRLFAQQALKKESLVVISTPHGDMTLYLYPKTAAYKSNFLKLVRERQYDSTVFYLNLKQDIVQGGIHDTLVGDSTKYAQKDIGYTLPFAYEPSYFHKRGALAAATTTMRFNPEKKASGNIFYLVSGRKYTNDELDRFQKNEQDRQLQLFGQFNYLQRQDHQWLHKVNWEKLQKENPDSIQRIGQKLQAQMEDAFNKEEKKFEFTAQARAAYQSIGGAADRDHQATVFGEIISGLDVLDKIAALDVKEKGFLKSNVPMTAKIIEMEPKEILKTYNFRVEP
jgi:peptidylprolyl isomerase